MSIDVNDEILQDFLVEAGEILDQLSEQLVDLEQQPDDYDLLNAVFRGFHTIKGGAGFLSINSLVEICHRSEDVFNVLRQGQRSVSPDLMDSILQVLDVVNSMFDLIRDGTDPNPADAQLIQRLNVFSAPQSEGQTAPSHTEEKQEKPVEVIATGDQQSNAEVKHNELSDSEFEELLDAIQEPTNNPSQDDQITEDEFESLLDELHGKGRFNTAFVQPIDSEKIHQVSDEIDENEFEDMLDQIHGKGQFYPSKVNSTAPSEQVKYSSVRVSRDEGISEDEFENILDETHGKVRFNVGASGLTGRGSNSSSSAEKYVVAPKSKVNKAKDELVVKAESKSDRTAPEIKIPSKSKPVAETTVRVDTKRLDDIMNMVGELVLVRNRLANLKTTMKDEDVSNAVGNLDVVTADLQLAVMKTRMQPIKKVFGRFPRVVRDLARSMKKEIDLEMVGEDTDLDKNLVEALADPMVHLVRNSVDHGIEMPDEREKAGKPRRGTVLLSAAQEGDHILLSISDDGKGMDPEILRHKAIEKGMMDQETAARMDNRECYNLIFHAGFSTKNEISDVSGRGVGMDVVKTRIAQMNGSVEIDSELGRGSLITIKLPLTLAILPTLMVILKQQPFALPLASVVEIFNLDLNRTHVVDGQLTLVVRERAIPLFYLREWLVPNSPLSEDDKISSHVVIVNVGNIQVGLVVDELIGQEEVVIKPLGALLQGLEGMAGATITGDGKIALIVDVPGLMRKYARKN